MNYQFNINLEHKNQMIKTITLSSFVSLLAISSSAFAHHEAVHHAYDFKTFIFAMIAMAIIGASYLGVALIVDLRKKSIEQD